MKDLSKIRRTLTIGRTFLLLTDEVGNTWQMPCLKASDYVLSAECFNCDQLSVEIDAPVVVRSGGAKGEVFLYANVGGAEAQARGAEVRAYSKAAGARVLALAEGTTVISKVSGGIAISAAKGGFAISRAKGGIAISAADGAKAVTYANAGIAISTAKGANARSCAKRGIVYDYYKGPEKLSFRIKENLAYAFVRGGLAVSRLLGLLARASVRRQLAIDNSKSVVIIFSENEGLAYRPGTNKEFSSFLASCFGKLGSLLSYLSGRMILICASKVQSFSSREEFS